MQAKKRLSDDTIKYLRREIAEAGGNEVFALGWLDESGLVARAEVLARGNEGAVLARREDPFSGQDGADALIHNHPSGFLVPSDNDLAIAARAAEDGTGSFIVDNSLSEIYVVAEPVRRKPVKKLDEDEICAALEEGGAVAGRLPSFELRQSQLGLMRLIIRGFNRDALVAAEAGTGVGKSFAYLLPAMRYALDNDERIVISTATINLQQQLYEKDIPLVSSALGEKIRVVLVKGRGNYLCRRRLDDACANLEPGLFSDEEADTVRAIAAWAETAGSGSRSDLSFVPPEAVWSRVCSEADLCMGMRCPERERCFVLALRKKCADARIIVVNHHLLFADLAARYEGAGYDNTVVLPPYRRVVIDEAHTIENSATSFFSQEFSRLGLYRQMGRLYRRHGTQRSGLILRLVKLLPASAFSPDISPGSLPPDAVLKGIDESVSKLRSAVDKLDGEALVFCGEEGVFRLSAEKEGAIAPALIPRLRDLRRLISSLAGQAAGLLENVPEDAADNAAVWEVKAVVRRLENIAAVCTAFIEYRERPGEVMWLERHAASKASGSGDWVVFTATPLDVAPSLKGALFDPNKTVICVSATLAVESRGGFFAASGDGGPDAAFAYWASRSGAGLVKGRELLSGRFPSPFPYASSVLLAIPTDAPLPAEPAFRPFVDRAAASLAENSGGSALVLFTSYDALKSAWAAARPLLEEAGIRCLKQGDDDRGRLLKTFLGDKTSVLFATDSFWEGVDAPGDTLRLVVLCRLPFKSPSDPVFEARAEALEKRGGNAFMDLSLPEAVIKFKQGFGRLMRRSSDRGVVAVLDGRVLRKRYGEYFLRSIPQTRRSFASFDAVLRDTENFLFPG
ncbi:MAG: ATP-dependent DNA helicase DinG [Spirochaetaceae bacterium]|nr:ATP-dependent DNA helicase DinG [Spirochaetaceae bacterium]